MKVKSFAQARNAFKKNLADIMDNLNLYPTTLASKLNTANGKTITDSQTIHQWTEGKKIPSVYALYKVCDYLGITMDDMFNPAFKADKVTGRSYAAQSVDTPKVNTPITPKCPTNWDEVFQDLRAQTEKVSVAPKVKFEEIEMMSFSETLDTFSDPWESINTNDIQIDTLSSKETTMTNTNTTTTTTNTTKRDRTPFETRKQLVAQHTTSPKYNTKLAYAILNSGKTLKEISNETGIPTRCLRDYAYYSVSISPERAKALLKALNMCNYKTIGLRLATDTLRYVSIKA